jgi:hypothetical protein
MGAHLKLVDTAYLPASPPVRSSAPTHPSEQKIRRRLTLAEVTIAVIAGVLAAWIID